MGGPRQRLEPPRSDVPTTPGASTERSVVESSNRRVNLGKVLDGPVPEREVTLLVENLARRRGLGPVGHLVGHLDRLAELFDQAGTFGLELRAKASRNLGIHLLTLRAVGPVRTRRYTPWEYPRSTT